MVYISVLGSKITMQPVRKAQMALLLAKKITVPGKYLDFANIFLEKLATILPEQTKVNKHAIKVEKGNQPFYRPIYSLDFVKLGTFKTYIKINLSNSFIRDSKSPAGPPILFVCKPNASSRLFVDY